MELSGEILSGHFFEGIKGLQFISHEALRFLSSPLNKDSIYWFNASDPASLCGVKFDKTSKQLPRRLVTTYLVYHGKKLVIISKKTCKQLEIKVPYDNPNILKYFSFFKSLIGREFNPLKSLLIESINNEPAHKSQYVEPLIAFGFSKDYKGLELFKGIR